MSLAGRVAVVTGASRGVGKGIALELGAAGATVYATGRTVAPADRGAATPEGSLAETCLEIEALGGRAVAVRCDHARDEEVAALFDRVAKEAGRLDVLVNNAFAFPDVTTLGRPFWEQPIAEWDKMHGVGLRSHYVASVFGARLMVPAKRGLIVNVSSYGGGRYAISVAYGVGKAGVDRLAHDLAHELKPHGVAAVSLWPGIVRTERLVAADGFGFDMSRAESARYSGRGVVALAGDEQVLERTGQVLLIADLADHYGFTDLDGTRPRAFKSKKK